MRYEAVFWDFDGVWSKDRFYQSLETTYPQVHEFIQTRVWGPDGEGRVDKWMKAEINMDDINRLISQETGIDFGFLTRAFLEDAAKMEIEMRHVPIVKELIRRGVKVGMITNNMDVFTSVTIPRLKLLDLFEGRVFNSADHGVLKTDGLYDIAVGATGVQYATSLMIDDSPRARTAFEVRGGQTYAYNTFEEFESWANIIGL